MPHAPPLCPPKSDVGQYGDAKVADRQPKLNGLPYSRLTLTSMGNPSVQDAQRGITIMATDSNRNIYHLPGSYIVST